MIAGCSVAGCTGSFMAVAVAVVVIGAGAEAVEIFGAHSQLIL